MRKPAYYSNLHCHSHFSVNDSLDDPQRSIDYVLEQGGDAMAVTDHGNMSGFCHADIYTKDLISQGRQFKFIPGCEMYLHPDLAQWARDKASAREEKEEQKDDDDEAETESGSYETKDRDPLKRRHHLVVLAKTSLGLKNLFRLVTRSHREGFYRYPRIDYAMLKEHSEGLIVSSACLSGPLAYEMFTRFPDVKFEDVLPTDERFDEIQAAMANVVDRLSDSVGRDNVFLELQFNRFKAQHAANRHIMELSKRTGMPLITTCDSHYPRPELWQSREIYKKLGWLNHEKIDPKSLPQTIDDLPCELYPKSAEQMWDAYRKYCSEYDFYDDDVICDAIERTHDVAHNVIGDVQADTSVKLPSYAVPEADRDDEMRALVKEAYNGLERLGLNDEDEYVERLKHELKVIKKCKFARYFLTMKMIMDIARQEMLVGAARGSSGGSLVCYCLNITQIDPIKYGLLFERFLNLWRVGMPDIDNDFANRDRLIEMLQEQLGIENVLPICNYNTFKIKSLVKDLSRFYSIPFDEVNKVTQQMDSDVRRAVFKPGVDKNTFELTYDACMEHSPSFQGFVASHPEISEHLSALVHQNKAIGTHAGGVIVSENLDEAMPQIRVRGRMQVPWVEGLHNKHLDRYGLIKFDLLGLDTLRIIQRAIELILEGKGTKNPTFEQVRDWYEMHLHPSRLDLDDPKVYQHVYHDGRWAGIFQCTSASAQRFFKKAKPNSIVDLAALTSIYRPGPLAANVDKTYVAAKNAPESVVYEHPLVREVLEPTAGAIVFQEQTLKLASLVGKMTPENCDKLRKTLMKKSMSGETKRKKEIDKLHKMFVEGAIENGLSETDAKSIFQRMAYFSGYGFVKCLGASELVDIFKADGTFLQSKRIRHVKPGEYVCSRDEATKSDVFVQVTKLHKNGIQRLVEITLDTGKKVRCTMNHKFRTTTREMLPLYAILEQKLEIIC